MNRQDQFIITISRQFGTGGHEIGAELARRLGVKLLDKQEIKTIAEKMNVNRYTKRLDAYQHLVIMLYAQLGQFDSLREVELGFLCAASRMNHFGIDYMVRRSTLSDANARRTPAFFESVYKALYERYSAVLADSRPVKGQKARYLSWTAPP